MISSVKNSQGQSGPSTVHSVPVEASAGALTTASLEGAGFLKSGPRFLGPHTPAPSAVPGAWEALTTGSRITGGPPRNVSVRPVGDSELADNLAEMGHNVSVGSLLKGVEYSLSNRVKASMLKYVVCVLFSLLLHS